MAMEFQAAATHARQMKRFFSAFESLEEMLVAAARSEQATREAEAKKVSLDADIAELTTEYMRLKDRSLELNAEIETLKPEAERYKVGLAAAHQQFLAEIEADKATALSGAARARAEAKAAGEEAKRVLAEEITVLNGTVANALNELAQAETGLAKFKSDLGGVG